jgi:tyrosyl-tRNA synthetase
MAEWCRLLSAGDWTDLAGELKKLADGEGDPMALKHDLSQRIVTRLHGEKAAESARAHFQRVVQRKEVPTDIPGVDLRLGDRSSIKLFEVLVEAGLAPSKSEARRLVQQGAVSVDGERLSDPTRVLAPGEMLIQVGKRRFARVQIRR